MGRVRPADLLAGLGGVLLLVALFLPWYGLQAPPQGENLAAPALAVVAPDITGWAAFTVIDVLLAVAALIAIAVPVVTAIAEGPAKPVGTGVIASVTSLVALLLLVFRLLDAPADLLVPRWGAWLGLAMTALMLAGSFLSLKDERTAGVEPPAVPVRPAPPA